MRILIIVLLTLLSNTLAKTVNDYLSDESITLDAAPSISTSDMGGLKGIDEDLPKTRSQETVIDEVQDNQHKLTNIYKKYAMKDDAEGISKIFGMVLTIDNNGDVVKVIVKNIPNKEFAKEVQENVMTWQFSKVKASELKTFSFRNLDFIYHKELNFSDTP